MAGLLERPVHKDYVMLAPPSALNCGPTSARTIFGTQLTLMSLAFEGSMGGMMGMMGAGRWQP